MGFEKAKDTGRFFSSNVSPILLDEDKLQFQRPVAAALIGFEAISRTPSGEKFVGLPIPMIGDP
ncbi:MAG: hypothetical protein H6916_01320 [Novosphingobium sp.]|uniref:hypothetical protein n=1 Tax=Novosphingobium sp. TaxID=1874826 RepID=UPI00262E87DA|nr:hypothetical protein [Novosphingobium sp.]MCP5385443.1 hypothetical protein [Novosphingobium sp.]